MYYLKILFGAAAFLSMKFPVFGEVFTAMADVEDLLDSERLVVQTLEEYLIAEEERLQKIKK